MGYQFKTLPVADGKALVTKKPTAAGGEIARYAAAIANLKSDQSLEFTPSNGEPLARVKVHIARAIKESGVKAVYGEGSNGALIVWLDAEAFDKAAAQKASAQARKKAKE